MKKLVSYCCEICDEEFDDETEAREHEALHSICVCQGGINPEEDTIRVGMGYSRSVRIYIDFENSALVSNYIDDGSRPFKRINTIPIKYCPFCGRDLKGGS